MHGKIKDFVIVEEVPEFGEIVIMSKGVKKQDLTVVNSKFVKTFILFHSTD
ncbi:MAG: hypothetical protein ABIM20_06970 [candidate division WOR-3 bacterium]